MKLGKLSEIHAKKGAIVSAALSEGSENGLNFFRDDFDVAGLKAPRRGATPISADKKTPVSAQDAAQFLADALVSRPPVQGVLVKLTREGRINIIAQRSGLLCLDQDRICDANKIAPALCLATLRNLTRVTAGMTVASIDVLSREMEADLVARACAAIEEGVCDAMTIRAAVRKTATLIETHHPGSGIPMGGRRSLEERLDRLGTTLLRVKDIPHEEGAIVDAIRDADGEVLIIFTATPTENRTDCAPVAVVKAGGVVERLGMPVFPGHSLFLGAYNGRPLLGLPSSARSLGLNGADWVLERLVCGIPVSGDDIAAMAVGGLLGDGRERNRFKTLGF